MKARMIQLLARLIGVALTALASRLQFRTSDVDVVAEAAAVAIVALGAFGVDLFLHWMQQQEKGRL